MLYIIGHCVDTLCRTVSTVTNITDVYSIHIIVVHVLTNHPLFVTVLLCRLSFVTEQVAAHTNGTIGALLNATFGNAPELLIATAALRSGFYRVVQLAMLGSMLTNLLFVFGIACVVGGTRWQVQELRITSGNVNVGLLLVSVAASLLPAALIMSGQLRTEEKQQEGMPSKEELLFSRINAFVMVFLYCCYLVFQLGTHKEEFDEEENVVQAASGHELHLAPHFTSRHGRQKQARRNLFCQSVFSRCMRDDSTGVIMTNGGGDVELSLRQTFRSEKRRKSDNGAQYSGVENDGDDQSSTSSSSSVEVVDLLSGDSIDSGSLMTDEEEGTGVQNRANRRKLRQEKLGQKKKKATNKQTRSKSHDSEIQPDSLMRSPPAEPEHGKLLQDLLNEFLCVAVFYFVCLQLRLLIYLFSGAQMTFRAGIAWLLIITLCISAMSDILVDTIDGFAFRANLSEVFTSMVILPFFSNVAEQVSAVLFAYRNEMDLCVGVTVGSAIQVATFVLPGCVLIGMMVDRSMTLFFHGYETACLFLAVIVVAAVLQGGTTNWLVGVTLIGIYIMLAAGFWFHELEDLSIDAEIAINNSTRLR